MRHKRRKAPRPPVCPYCGSLSVLRESSYVYANHQFEKYLYVCARYPQCNSYVGVHKNSLRPKGTLANGDLRYLRIETHRVFNRLWEEGIMTRQQAYRWLQDLTGLPERYAHIGMFSKYRCNQLMAACRQVLENHKLTEKEGKPHENHEPPRVRIGQR